MLSYVVERMDMGNCFRCGKGKLQVRFGQVTCAWCGATVEFNHVIPYSELKVGEEFVSASDSIDSPTILKKGRGRWIKKPDGGRIYFGPDAPVVSLRRLKRRAEEYERESEREWIAYSSRSLDIIHNGALISIERKSNA